MKIEVDVEQFARDINSAVDIGLFGQRRVRNQGAEYTHHWSYGHGKIFSCSSIGQTSYL